MSETNAEQPRETRGFATEARQLLHLMIHSLYSNREIFLRELISNASDAADKLRYESLTHPEWVTSELGVWISFDKDNKTLTVRDSGIGMSRQEVIDNLGTIARSGTAEFLSKLGGDQRKDAQLIGQFGVGFYSAFIVAERVEVRTRRAGDDPASGTLWESKGESDYSLQAVDRTDAGTEITLHIRDDADEFLDDARLRHIVRQYSDHIAIPVHIAKPDSEGFDVVNQAKALWARPRTDISDEEYKQFYRHVSHDFEDPLTWSHNKVEGRLEYTSLLYIPKRAPFDLWQRDGARGVKLYVRRVFIMDDAEQFLPIYLRFVKGVLDCPDLPLNVSRELLQQDKQVDSIRQGLVKRVLDMLKKLADDAEQYQSFWREFGRVLKEAPAEDTNNRQDVAKLYRFASTKGEGESATTSFDDYIGRMREGQDKIYYVCADNFLTASSSPHLEIFRKREIEVLILFDRIDDWMMTSLHEFDGKQLLDITRGDLGLDKIKVDAVPAADAENPPLATVGDELLNRVKEALGDQVNEVKRSERLVDSPACLVLAEHDMGSQMRRLLAAAGQEVPAAQESLELNLDHPLLARLDAEPDEARFGDLAQLLLDQARLAEGTQLADPGAFVARLNRLLLDLSRAA